MLLYNMLYSSKPYSSLIIHIYIYQVNFGVEMEQCGGCRFARYCSRQCQGGLGVMVIMLCGALIVGEHMSLGGALAGNTGKLSTATSRRRSTVSGGSVS